MRPFFLSGVYTPPVLMALGRMTNPGNVADPGAHVADPGADVADPAADVAEVAVHHAEIGTVDSLQPELLPNLDT